MSLNQFDSAILGVVIVLIVMACGILASIIYIFIYLQKQKEYLKELEEMLTKTTKMISKKNTRSPSGIKEESFSDITKMSKVTKLKEITNPKSKIEKIKSIGSQSTQSGFEQAKPKEKSKNAKVTFENDQFPQISQIPDNTCSVDISMDNFVGNQLNTGIFKQYKIAKPRSKENVKIDVKGKGSDEAPTQKSIQSAKMNAEKDHESSKTATSSGEASKSNRGPDCPNQKSSSKSKGEPQDTSQDKKNENEGKEKKKRKKRKRNSKRA